MTAPAPASPFAYRDFRLFFVAKFLSTLATVALVVAMQWHVYQLARDSYHLSINASGFQVSLLGLAQFLALLLFFLPGGYAVDRFDRRHLAWAGIACEIVCVLALWWLVRGAHTIGGVILIAAMLGMGRAFAAPALQALAPNLVPPDVLPAAIAWNSIAWQTAAVTGPVATGVMLSAGGMALVTQLCVGLLSVSLGFALLVRAVPRPVRSTLSPWQSVVEGLRYVRNTPIVLGAISLDLFAVLLGGATAMLPAFARDILVVGETGFAWLRAAPAMGAALVALWFTQAPLRSRVGPRMFAAVVGFGLATIVFGVSTSFWLSMLALVALGATDMVSVYVRSSLIQLHTPDAMRGRVSSVSTLFIGASNELGEVQSGIASLAMGPQGAVVFGGVGALLVASLWARWFPQLRTADRMDVAR